MREWTKFDNAFRELARQTLLALIVAVAIPPGAALAQANDASRNMNQPVEPFHIIGNIYYVGASDIGSYLMVTPAGDILLDGGFVETAPMIEANIKKLGFKLTDVKYILSSHEHLDHAGGISELQRATGAEVCGYRAGSAGTYRGHFVSCGETGSRNARRRHCECRRGDHDGAPDSGAYTRLHDMVYNREGWRTKLSRRVCG